MRLLDELKNIQEFDKIDIGQLTADWEWITKTYPTLNNIDDLLNTLTEMKMYSPSMRVQDKVTLLQKSISEHGLKLLDVVLEDYKRS